MRHPHRICSKQVNKSDAQRKASRPSQTPESPPLHPFLCLQRVVGNQAVSRSIQAKLTVSPPDDQYEREADRVAAEVVSRIHIPEKASLHQTALVQRQVIDNEEKAIRTEPLSQRKSARGGMEAPLEIESSIQSARGGGQPLADSVRVSMEDAFGEDFSGVRVHAGVEADALNRLMGARAFTTGQDIFFRAGELQLGNREGQRLLAHELTHVVQQRIRSIGSVGEGQTNPFDQRLSCIQRYPVKKDDGSGDYHDPRIPGATLRATGTADSHGNVEYEIQETKVRFLYNTSDKCYYQNSTRIRPEKLAPSEAPSGTVADGIGLLISRLKESVMFVSAESKGVAKQLLAELKAGPGTFDELEKTSETANQIYAQFDHQIRAEDKEEMSAYRIKLNDWARLTQSLVYNLRDELLIESPEALERYSLTEQYKKKYPDSIPPSELSALDQTLGVVIFDKGVGNDCGRFANALFEQRKRDILGKFMKERLSTEDALSQEEIHKLLSLPAVEATRHAKLEYKPDPRFPYPHHAKTSLAEIGGRIYALEAHKGKPFLLAPELQVYESKAKFLEEQDPYVGKRSETDLKTELSKELLTPESTDKQRYDAIHALSGIKDVLPTSFGKRPESFKPKNIPLAPGVKMAAPGEQESEEKRDWRDALAYVGVETTQQQDELIPHLADGKEAGVDSDDIIAAWCIGGNSFDENTYKAWLVKNISEKVEQ